MPLPLELMEKKIHKKRPDEMRATARSCRKELKFFSKPLNEFRLFEDDDLADYLTNYLSLKLNDQPLRPFFARTIFKYVLVEFGHGKKIPQFPKELHTVYLPFMTEVIIAIQYLDNQILDEKLGVKMKAKAKLHQNLLSGNVMRDLLFIYIEERIGKIIGYAKTKELIRMVRKLLMVVDIGQRADKLFNVYSMYTKDTTSLERRNSRHRQLSQLLPAQKMVANEAFSWMEEIIEEIKQELGHKMIATELYFRRIYMTNVLFFLQITDIVLMILEVDQEEAISLRKYTTYYGFMLQIINDYADFAHGKDEESRALLQTNGRKTTDQFSDLRNKNVTLPLIYYLRKHFNRVIEKYLRHGKKSLVMDQREQIMKDMLRSGAIQSCLEISQRLAGMARAEINNGFIHGKYLIDMTYMADENKFKEAFT